ncbi:MAG TPA: carbohydrate kinase [Natronosporangium sp.]|nr:carbohydrate kinase [Natronosporangium sp.]
MIVVAGEALVDLTPTAQGAGAHDDGGLEFTARPGGSPFNVAIGLGRLGTPVAFLGVLSGDAFGRRLRAHLRTNGVDLSLVVPAGAPTALAFAHLAGAEPEYSFYVEGTTLRAAGPDAPALPPGAPLHTGSLALALEPSAGRLAGLLRAEAGQRLISVDPNIRPGLIPDRGAYLDQLGGWLGAADLVKVSAADLAWLYPHETPAEVARRWLAAGPVLVLVTAGSQGATAFTGRREVFAPAATVTVADTIGAGDAFSAATLAWLWEQGVRERGALAGLDEAALRRLLTFANQVAAHTCARPGADPPRREELAVHAG